MNILIIVIISAVAWSTLGTIVYYVIESVTEIGDSDLAMFGAIFAPVSTIIVTGYLIGIVLILITQGLISRFIICLKTIDKNIYNKMKGDDND